MRYFVPSLYACLLLLFTHAASAQCPAPVPLSINPVVTTESRCQSSGTATVQVTGGTAPFIYSIIAGPALSPAQSSNVFQSLQSGSYTVQVTDNCGTSRTRTFVVSGSYAVPEIYPDLQSPTCPGNQDGSMTVNVLNGRAPFTYALVSPSPVTAPPQAGNQFTGLPAGAYSVQVTDSCGNFQTRTVTLPDGNPGSFWFNYFDLYYENCDSFSIAYSIGLGYVKLPYTATLTLPDGNVLTHVLTSSNAANAILDTFHFRYVHQRYTSRQITLNVVNSCGTAVTNNYDTHTFNMWTRSQLIPDCSKQYRYTFDPYDNSETATPSSRLHCNTITYTLVSPAGLVLTTQTNNSTFSGYPAGNGYRVVREDCCMKDTIQFNWATAPDFKILGYNFHREYVTRDGTTVVRLGISSANTGSVIIAQGPPSVTYRNGAVHTYTYPDTVKDINFYNSGVYLHALTAGTWKVIAMDTCGQKDSVTFTITQANLRHDTFSATLKRGCIGANKIIWNATSNMGSAGNLSAFVLTPGASGGFQWSTSFADTDSLVNLSSGTYTLYYQYTASIPIIYHLQGMSYAIQDTIPVTVVVPPYAQPAFALSPAVAVCGGSRTVALLPDSTVGVAPYQYRITSGAVTTPMQSNPVFANLPIGTYNMLMADACGNSYSRNVSIDSLRLTTIATIGSTCQGGTATLSLPANPYYTYSWQTPNGNTVTGNTITLNPVTQADTGRYLITVTSNIDGCTDTRTSAVQLNFCSTVTLPLTLLHFNGSRQGNNIVLQWQTADEVNTSHFIVERSEDGVHFTALQKVNTSGIETGNYSATDYRPMAGKISYRLQMVDKDGKVTYSQIITIKNPGNNTLTVTPRLLTGNQEVKVNYTATTQPAYIQITSIDGKVYLTQTVTKGSRQTTLATGRLPKGNYLVVFVNNGVRTALRVVKW
ncbi:hypothetical protein FAM09_28000 [Niastella caeni]|uniref:T9SS type A sorting domain-containing protein n=1 Tax=Niastella caeni TaxID=2569763 RepID=A0A4S8HAS6_9BACT|nr:hypothetical protein [Niastella caeni]THU32030.1 hypothetical protein FAM09_28000 [Niastella caeni]